VRDPRERLRDIIEAIDAIGRYTHEGRRRFDDDELVRSWVLQHLQIIGEAAARLPDEVRGRAPEIPWVQVIATRNVLVHGYFGWTWTSSGVPWRKACRRSGQRSSGYWQRSTKLRSDPVRGWRSRAISPHELTTASAGRRPA
jgi:uncharacterized protein with HEPN domain